MSEYKVTRLLGSTRIEGKLLLFPDRVIFEPKKKEYGARYKDYAVTEIPMVKMKCASIWLDEKVNPLTTYFFGPVTAAIWKTGHKILVIDFEDDHNIIQRWAFDGKDTENAAKELHDMKKTSELSGPAQRWLGRLESYAIAHEYVRD